MITVWIAIWCFLMTWLAVWHWTHTERPLPPPRKPPPVRPRSRRELIEDEKRRYREELIVLDGLGLEPDERSAAQEKARSEHLWKIEELLR